MRCELLGLCCSVLAVLAGLTMVLSFSHVFVVPHLKLHDFVHTECTVVAMNMGPNYPISDNGTEDVSSPECLQIRVRYQALGGVRHEGILYSDTRSYDDRENLGKCACGGCKVQVSHVNDDGAGSPGGKSVILVRTAYISGRTIAVGSTMRCYYRAYGGPTVLRWRTGPANHLVLHAMLWPSLLFIMGFVGVFFSFLAIQEELHGRKKGRRARRADREKEVTTHAQTGCYSFWTKRPPPSSIEEL